MLRNATLFEVRQAGYVIGPFIDIFPLDGCSEQKNESNRCLKWYQELIGYYRESVFKYSITYYLSFFKRGQIKFFANYVFSRLQPRKHKERLLKKMECMNRQYDFNNAKKMSFHIVVIMA